MENLEILEQCKNKTLSELIEIIGLLKDLYNTQYYNTYKEVRIHPGSVITNTIENETGFRCFHEKPSIEYSAGRGTHVIVIPKKDYTTTLEKEQIGRAHV